MEIFIGDQLKNIVYSFTLGLIFGGFYDIICIMHIILGVVSDSGDKVSRTDVLSRILFFVTDMTFMVAVTVMMSIFLYEFASGEFRMYLLAAATVGFTVHRCTLGKIVSAVSEVIVHQLRRCIRLFVIRPVRAVCGCVGKHMHWLYGRTVWILIGYIRIMVRERYLRDTQKRLVLDIRIEPYK